WLIMPNVLRLFISSLKFMFPNRAKNRAAKVRNLLYTGSEVVWEIRNSLIGDLLGGGSEAPFVSGYLPEGTALNCTYEKSFLSLEGK
ncbi:MAG: hypothetical protein KDC43_03105, partial [Saprospiraceae bacterium]|nr:hypothetical protein [Saprospiraceae bacterium]MCB0622923.1 hypothetical protein [Saprospiraceae bacterium]MCB0680192.1 hypothetical protein [Saprospiraceae bacterium]